MPPSTARPRTTPWAGTPPWPIRLLWAVLGAQVGLVIAAIALKGRAAGAPTELLATFAVAGLAAMPRWRPKPFSIYIWLALFELLIAAAACTVLLRDGFRWQLAALGLAVVVVLGLELRLRALGWYSMSLTERLMRELYPLNAAEIAPGIPVPQSGTAAPSPLIHALAASLAASHRQAVVMSSPPGVAALVVRNTTGWVYGHAFVVADDLSRDAIAATVARLIDIELTLTHRATPLWFPMPGNLFFSGAWATLVLCLVYERGAPADAHGITAHFKSEIFENTRGQSGAPATSTQTLTWVLDVPAGRVFANPFPPLAATVWPGPKRMARLLRDARG